MGGDFLFFFLFKRGRGESKKSVDDAFARGETAAVHPAFAIGTALLGENGSLLLQAEAVGGVWFFCCVLLVQGYFCGGLIPLILSCLLLCFNALQLEKEMSLLLK